MGSCSASGRGLGKVTGKDQKCLKTDAIFLSKHHEGTASTVNVFERKAKADHKKNEGETLLINIL